MITRHQLEQLQDFRGEPFWTTSCYLNVDRAHTAVAQLKLEAKDQLRAAAQSLPATATRQQRDSVLADLEKIERFVLEDALTGGQKAVAIFSCTGQKYWQLLRLPRPLRSQLSTGPLPLLGPLLSVLAGYRRFCTVVLDRAQGRLFDMYLGRIQEQPLAGTAPAALGREPGGGGLPERGWDRHQESLAKQHYQRLAETLFAHYKQSQFDDLLLVGARDVLAQFKACLHPYLRQRWVGDLPGDPHRINAQWVLEQTLECEQQLQAAQTARLADQIQQRAAAGQQAIVGVEASLTALFRGQAQCLVLGEGLNVAGFVCRDCQWAGPDRELCPHCSRLAQPCADLAGLAVELARQRGCQVQVVELGGSWQAAGGMGVALRY